MDTQTLKSQDSYDQAGVLKIYSKYKRNYLAVGSMWGVFTVCFAIIILVVFFQPQWIGDTEDSLGTGYFGLYEYCELIQSGKTKMCSGAYRQFSSIISVPFQVATFFIGIAGLLILVCICCIILFLFLSPSTVFKVCGCLQIASAVCILLGCIIYPAGWNNEIVQRVCGSDAGRYNPGQCGIRWAFVLAIISIFDAIILSALAFVLASRYIRSPSVKTYSSYQQDIDSKPAMYIQPGSGELTSDRFSDHHSIASLRGNHKK